jgi:hypothetical protein
MYSLLDYNSRTTETLVANNEQRAQVLREYGIAINDITLEQERHEQIVSGLRRRVSDLEENSITPGEKTRRNPKQAMS